MNNSTTLLTELKSGTRAVVREMRGGRSILSRLSAMGLSVGSELEVLNNRGRGPLLVLVRDTRIALGRGEAQKIVVEELIGE
jgi:ferrous iron transport protein A